ncbi:MAG TPA: hypothetical protein VE959_06595 [Bryobacteraceae bacterium]|nr:hypothetical protein [Bryobacteraceae bacterium]
MELSGDTLGARAALARGAANNPDSVAALTAYAEFLDRYGDPGARAAYGKLLAALRNPGDRARAAAVARRLAAEDLAAGDRDAASRDMEAYRAASGNSLTLGAASQVPAANTISLPGPLRSFARMAAISKDASPEDILPALARNVVTNGYQASHSNDALEQTEYLKLVHRYLSQARELSKLAGDQKVIKAENCESPNVAELLRILGFRMRGGCGSEVVLETVNASRAFLTKDSGFPLHELEQDLRTNRPFSYDYPATQVPILFGTEYWFGSSKEKESADYVENFISDPSVCRLYLGLAKLDGETGEALRKSVPYARLKAFSHVLDFFGGMFEIRGGKAIVPGGQRSAAAWTELAGVSPDKGTEFFDKLIARDDGWMASMFDALARIHGPLQEYLTEPARLKRFYSAVRGRITSPGPARPVFRSNTDMMLLTTRLQLDASGKPHIPGSLDVWKTLFVNHPQGKYDGKLTRLATTWKEPDDVLEALFALCRKAVENEPLKIFMALSDIDRNRAAPLNADTVDRLAREYHTYGSQYSIFNESRGISDQTVNQFLAAMENISKIRDPLLRSDVAGSFQSLAGLWQIFVRQQTIPESKADAVLLGIANSFAQIRGDRELFDAGREVVKQLLAASPQGSVAANDPQGRILDVLSGQSGDTETRDHMLQELGRILEAQRIVPLNTLFQLADHLDNLGKGEKLNTALVNRLAARIGEIQLPRASLSSVEKNAMGFGYWTDRHIENQRKTNVRASIEKAAGDAEKLKEVRGQLAPILRDTLLAFNYAYYAPPGAQIVFTNPVFVRSHDFIGMQGTAHTWRPTESFGTGWPSNGGGRLVGSLSSLPYALAEAEQNFLVPTQTQALIWGDLVPQMMISAKISRWWNVTPSQVHWVGLHLRYGQELVAESALDADLRAEVIGAFSLFAPPARARSVESMLARGEVREALDHVTPSELFSIARELAAKRPAGTSCLQTELRQLAEASPKEVNYAVISRAFGTPKPTLANSYEPELLGLRTFPALMGYSSRIMAESWESNTLYWVALADELSLPPAQLNVRIPEWTEKLVEQIFASHLEDWPALLKSLRTVGDDVRTHARAAMASEQKASLETPNR